MTKMAGETLQKLFKQGLEDPTIPEWAAAMWFDDPGKASEIAPRFSAWLKVLIPAVRAMLRVEGDIIVPVGWLYYEPARDDGYGGAGRDMPNPTDVRLIAKCMRPPLAGVVHCIEGEPNPLLAYSLSLLRDQVAGRVIGYGNHLAVCDSKQLLGPELKKTLKAGLFKFQLNG